MVAKWPSVAKRHVVTALKLGPIHTHKQHSDIIKVFWGGLRKESRLKTRWGTLTQALVLLTFTIIFINRGCTHTCTNI